MTPRALGTVTAALATMALVPAVRADILQTRPPLKLYEDFMFVSGAMNCKPQLRVNWNLHDKLMVEAKRRGPNMTANQIKAAALRGAARYDALAKRSGVAGLCRTLRAQYGRHGTELPNLVIEAGKN